MLERIRPTNISQEKWEEEFAWPANDKPPFGAVIRHCRAYPLTVRLAGTVPVDGKRCYRP
jgi:hypothetical protein